MASVSKLHVLVTEAGSQVESSSTVEEKNDELFVACSIQLVV
jgi:hypothetical protein